MIRIICCICLFVVTIGLFLCIKNEITFKNRIHIINAIFEYNEHLNDDEHLIKRIDVWNAMESYNKTLYRFWDFGCENIVSKEDYNKIKKYL